MSSHHIVRENQEPALLIVDVEAISEELLGQLLEWSPMLMTTQEHTDYLLSRGIKIDVIFSTIAIPENIQEDTLVIPLSDMAQLYGAALSHLESKNQFALHILCDRAFMKQELFRDERFTAIAFSNNTRYIAAVDFEKWLPTGQTLLIEHPQGNMETVGLIQVDTCEYRVVKDGFVRIAATDGRKIWIGERL